MFKPHSVQEAFLKVPDQVFEALYGGAAGGGKSLVLMLIPLVKGWVDHPRFKGIILRRTMPELEQEIIGRSHEWYGASGAVYNETKKRWVWPSGAEMRFGHAEQELSVKRYDGVEYNYIAWDEATSFTQFQYEYLWQRARPSSSDLPSIIRSATNPGGVGHDYFRKRFVEPCKAGGRLLKSLIKIPGRPAEHRYRIYIPCLPTDNPYLMQNAPQYLGNLAMISNEAERKAKLLGDWWTFEGQVFKEFRVAPFEGEPDYACHVQPYQEIPSHWPRFLAIDWGFKANTSMGWAALAPNGRAIVYRTYNKKGQYIKDWTRDAINLSHGEKLQDVVICHSANQNRGEPATILTQVQDAFDEAKFEVPVRLGEKDRVGGKQLMHEYLRWTARPDLRELIGEFSQDFATKLFRLQGTEAYQEYLNLFKKQEQETNLPKLWIFTSSPEGESNQMLIDTIGNCIYDEHKVEDVKEFVDDDPYDMSRMLVGAVDYYKRMNPEDTVADDKRQQALDKLKATNDQTAFYRTMEKIEAVESEEHQSVRRSGRRRRFR